MEELSDLDLVRRAGAGDRRAFDELVTRHERRVYNLAFRMLGREEDARDAAQDAFLSAFRRLSSFRGDAAFSTWLHRIAVNACYDSLRSRKRGPVLERMDEEGANRELGPPVADHADATASSIDVQRALREVPEVFRGVLVLHDIQGLPHEEIASILDVAVGTVKSRLHRGRVALGRALGVGPGRGGKASSPSGQEPSGPSDPSEQREGKP